MPKLRQRNVVEVVVKPDITPEQIANLARQLGNASGCRACGLLGIDFRLTAGDPDPIKELGLHELAGVQSVVVAQR